MEAGNGGPQRRPLLLRAAGGAAADAGHLRWVPAAGRRAVLLAGPAKSRYAAGGADGGRRAASGMGPAFAKASSLRSQGCFGGVGFGGQVGGYDEPRHFRL